MNVVDIVIIALVLLAVVDGAVNGVFVTFGKYAGAIAGLLAGALLAAALVDHFGLDRTANGFVIASTAVLLLVAVGYSLGILFASPIRALMSTTRVTGILDALLGAGLSVVIILFAAWTVASVLDRGPNSTTAELVQQSTLVRKLDAIAPSQPGFIAKLEQAIASNFGPDVFGGLEPSLPGAIGIDPATAATPGVRNAAASVTKIESRGCGGTLYGSGFPIAADEILTNAHVVAGTTQNGVRTTDGRLHAAKLILFDPERDVAVLKVDGLGAEPFQFVTAKRGTTGAVIGYPGGGKEQIAPAVIDGEITANGSDIYDRGRVTRDVWVVEGQVLPGNSGGPLVDTNGDVLGVIFSRSLSDSNKGFALTPKEIQPDLDALAAGHPPFDEGNYRCAS